MIKKIFPTFLVIFLFCGCSRVVTNTDFNIETSNEIITTTEDITTEVDTTEQTTEVFATEQNTTEEPTTEEITTQLSTEETTTEIQVSVDELNLMQLALLGKVDIYDTEAGDMKKVQELEDFYPEVKFKCIDLDGDGCKEIILLISMRCSILHEKDGCVYRYPISSRVSYNEDGTISGSSGANCIYLFRIKEFTETEMVKEYIYYADEGKYYKDYEFKGKEIELTEAEMATIREQYKEVILKESHGFNHNNIVTLLADW